MQIKVLLKKTAYLIGLLALGILVCFYVYARAHPRPTGTFYDYRVVTLKSGLNKSLKAYVAETPEARQRGLSGMRALPENYGMLFLFDEPGHYTFWMNDMYMSLDLIYISSERNVVEVISGVRPDTYPRTFQSKKGLYDAVLEVPAGMSEKSGLVEGARVEW